MAVTSGANSLNNSLQITGIRSAGLMSGMDTEAMVKQMSALTKSKINKQQQMLDKLVWKQNGYRDVISKMSAFKDTYLNLTKPSSNIKSAKLMAAFKAISNNAKVTATASANAGAGTYNITEIERLAKNAVIKSDPGFSMTNSGVKLDFSEGDATKSYNVNITLDGVAKDFAFTAIGGSLETGLLAAVREQFGAKGANFRMEEGALTYKTPDNVSHTFSIGGSNKLDPLSTQEGYLSQSRTYLALGLTNVTTNKVTNSTRIKDINFGEKLVGGSYSFTINGKKFNFSENTTVGEMTNTINGDGTAGVNLVFDSLAQKFSFTSKATGEASVIDIKQNSGTLLTAMFGSSKIEHGNTMSSGPMMNDGIKSSDMSSVKSYEDLKNMTMQVTVNGVTKTIGLWGYDTNGNKNNFENIYNDKGELTVSGQSKVARALNDQLIRAFGKNAPTFTPEVDRLTNGYTGKLTFTGNSNADQVKIGLNPEDENSRKLIEGLGFTAGQTNRLDPAMKLGDVGMGAGTININGVDVTSDTTFAELENIEGVKIDYERGLIITDRPVTTGDAEGDAFAKKIFGKNFAEYGGDIARQLEGDAYPVNSLTGGAPIFPITKDEKKFIITVNGVAKEITIPPATDDYTDEASLTQLTDAINTQLRLNNVGATISFENGAYTLKGGNPADVVSIRDSATDTTTVAALGFTSGASTIRVDGAAKLSDIMGGAFAAGIINVGGTDVTIDANTTLGELRAAGINYTLSERGVSFSTGKVIGAAGDGDALEIALFGPDYASYTGALPLNNSMSDAGTNAVLTVNGVKMESVSNNVVVNGTTIVIGDVDITTVTEDTPITITTTRDSAPAMETIKKFVEDYNALILDLNKTVDEKRARSGNSQTGTLYEPLTEEQKEEMTEKEIEAWDEKAKTGMLYGDQYVNATLTKMNHAMEAMSIDKYTLNQMGIKTSADYKDKGKLLLDEDAFKVAFEKDPEKIQELFTNPDTGLGVMMEKALDSAISQKKSEGLGSLIMIAGVPNTSTTADNTISRQIETYQKNIDDMKIRYAKEQQRYWNKFTYMETMMSKYNSQAAMFQQQG